VLPATDDTYDLGSQAKRWDDVWFSGALNGVTADNAANSGMAAGVQGVASLPLKNDGSNFYNVIQIGDKDGPLGAEIVIDPYWFGGVQQRLTLFITEQDYVASSGLLDGYWARHDGRSIWLAYEDHAVMELYRDHLKLRADIENVHAGFISIEDASESESVTINGDGTVIVTHLPTSDPAVAGQLWRSGNDLKVSTG
jgi:hypothetical protein